MRFLLIAILLICSCVHYCHGHDGQAGDVIPPFRVVYAAKSFRSSGDTLKSLDHIFETDKITVQHEGFLSLIHRTGFPVEVSGDSIVDISALHTLDTGDGKIEGSRAL